VLPSAVARKFLVEYVNVPEPTAVSLAAASYETDLMPGPVSVTEASFGRFFAEPFCVYVKVAVRAVPMAREVMFPMLSYA